MKPLRRSLASVAICIAITALSATPAAAAITLVNAGFETGNATGWHGNGSVTQGHAGFTAPAGSYFGVVRSPGCPGEMLEQHFTAAAGDVLSGWAFFQTGDLLPYDDTGAVRVVIERTGTDAVVFSSSVAEVGDLGATPWTRFDYGFDAPGSYAITVRVDNAVDCGEESAVGIDIAQRSLDDDSDAISDDADNCPGLENPDQLNQDGDEQGDACDADDDNDTFGDAVDNCPLRANSAQADTDVDGTGDACDADDDNDTVADGADNCPLNPNGDQVDADADGQGDACDADDDNDSVDDEVDNCDLAANTTQSDNDGDRQGDDCDADDDGDGVADDRDNCPLLPNPGQRDDDRDGIGNACDEHFDATAGRATGGGWIRHDGAKLSFSVSARRKRGVLRGACKVSFRHTKIRCLDVDGFTADPADSQVVLVGDAVVGSTPTRYRIVLRDGDPDRFRITTTSGFDAGGVVAHGKVRIRQG